MTTKVYAIDELRQAARYFDHLNETFNQSFASVDELVRLWRYAQAHPNLPEAVDTWPEAAIQDALAGVDVSPKRFEHYEALVRSEKKR